MGQLNHSVRLSCLAAAAESHLRTYVTQHATERGADSDSAQFNLRLPADALAALGLATTDRGVHVSLRLVRDGEPTPVRYRVRWTPERPGAHAMFYGELKVGDTAPATATIDSSNDRIEVTGVVRVGRNADPVPDVDDADDDTEGQREVLALQIDGRFELARGAKVGFREPEFVARIAAATALELLRQIEAFVLVEVKNEESRGGRRTNGVSHEFAG